MTVRGTNAEVLPFTKHKDGEGSDDSSPIQQVIIDTSENGFILTVNGDDELSTHKVYLYSGHGDFGPEALIQEVIDSLGLTDKVKISK